MTSGGMVAEYRALEAETDADLLAMQVGDFYEFFGAAARTAGEELDLKVSERSAGGETHDMAGVPVDDLTPYLAALVERGYRVAVADQHETGDGHARAIDRVVTPGTSLAADASHLAAVVRGEDREAYGVAFLDVTTGRFAATAVAGPDAAERALAECYRVDPAELLPGPAVREEGAFLAALRDRTGATVTRHDPSAFAPGRARQAVRERFGPGAAASTGLADRPLAVRAAGAALVYAEATGATALASVTRLRAYGPDEHATLDATTQRTLELVEPMTEGGRSLLDTLDHTVTSAGGRLLESWLGRPLRDRAELDRRHAAVEALAADALGRERLRDVLADAYDLERLASRAVSGSAGPDALLRVRATLAAVPDLRAAIDDRPELSDSPLAALLAAETDDLDALRGELAALSDDPPATLAAGGVFERGHHDRLDELIDEYEAAVEWFDGLEERERAATGIGRLSTGRNKTDGYYVQVPKSAEGAVPDRYEAIKTLKNSRRYVFPELTETERTVLRLEERRSDLERELFDRLRERVADAAELLQNVGRALAELDALGALAVHAVNNDWTRPTVTDGDELVVAAGRHPVVEATTEFVPNDLRLDRDRRFLLVTGPNMSGKSTYMRQAALITLLAQVGSFVPARSARIGLVDGIFTRVGAVDELAGGRSTFMVEMEELSNILHSATDDSLVVLDEVGRGTATYDGVSIAWAATEYLSGARGAAPTPKTLFATHYHELAALADRIDGVANVHMAVDEPDPGDEDEEVTFLRTVADGPADRSYGVHVAELAGVPDPVVERARKVLDRLRAEEAIEVRGGAGADGGDAGADGGTGTRQVVFDLGSGGFRGEAESGGESADDGGDADDGSDPAGSEDARDPAVERVLEELRGTDLAGTAPIELLGRVREWQERLPDPDAEREAEAGTDPGSGRDRARGEGGTEAEPGGAGR